MSRLPPRAIVVMASSILIAVVLSIIPLPTWLMAWRPQWIPLILLYWNIAVASRSGLFLAFCLGLILDVLSGSLFGAHALALVIIVYCANRIQHFLRIIPAWQSAIIAWLLVLVYELILIVIQGMQGQRIPTFWFIPLSVTCVLAWLFISIVLRRICRYYRIYMVGQLSRVQNF